MARPLRFDPASRPRLDGLAAARQPLVARRRRRGPGLGPRMAARLLQASALAGMAAAGGRRGDRPPYVGLLSLEPSCCRTDALGSLAPRPIFHGACWRAGRRAAA